MTSWLRILVLGYVWLTLAMSPCGAALRQRIDEIVKQNKKIQFGVHVVEATSGRDVYTYQERLPLIPASNMKIVTSAAALTKLGPDFVYETRVGLSGRALVVIGSGDPLLGDRETDEQVGRRRGWLFDDIAEKLAQAGVREVNNILIDSTVFDDERVHPHWLADDLNRDYACEVCGVNYNGNCVEMSVQNQGGKIRVQIDPQTRFVTIVNRVKAVRSGRGAVGAYRDPSQRNRLIVRGRCRTQQAPFNVAIEKPAVFLGYLLAEQLGRRGIRVKGELIEKAFVPPPGFRVLADYRTDLSQCLDRCNKDSFNLVAECLIKTMAARASADGHNGGWDKGRRVVEGYLRSLDIAPGEFVIDDGSGLSRNNRLSAHVLTSVLLSLYHSPQWPMYKDTLAIAGQDGTISNVFREETYRGMIYGKTGYINKVRAFSGLCETDHGKYIFSILANRANGIKSIVNDMVKAIFNEG